jgi:rSAM/selenodomain-associated transferase 2
MISIIIPAYNEAKALPHTLSRVLAQPGDQEVIVVDGGSADATREIAQEHPGVCVISAPKGRASQMNAGAATARGEWLLFLHADTLLPEGAIALLNALESNHDCQAGGFRQRFSSNDWRLRLVSWLHNKRCEHTRVIYGDQAMFVRRNLFLRLGGFPETRFLEDVMFSEKLVQATRPVLLEERVVTDARKFIKMGVARSFARVFVIMLCYELGLPIVARAFFSDVR